MRIYLQEGVVVAEMLQTWLKSSMAQTNHADLKPYMVKDLLDQFGLDLPAKSDGPNSNLSEPLTEREQEVLQLLALPITRLP